MDVRCEKCSTVYEFDDSRVGEQGVTVKCTQCGNLFKVKRRDKTAENAMGAAAARQPAYIPPTRTPEPPPLRSTQPGIAVLGKTPQARPTPAPAFAPTLPVEPPRQRIATPAPQPVPQPHAPPEASGWMIRAAATGDVYRFRELTTLQQWIVERKVSRDDEISRSGDNWKRLGGIAELESFFHVVEQAEAVARADGPRAAAQAAHAAYQPRGVASPAGDDDLALTTTAPMVMPSQPSGPTSLGNLMQTDEPAFARGRSTGRMAVPDEPLDDDEDLDRPPRRRGGLIAGMFAAGMVVAAGGYLALYKADAVRGLFSHGNARADQAYREGREYFLLDSDDNFRQAIAAYELAGKADERAAAPRAGLAEVKALWAGYLRDDAKALEAGSQAATAATAAKTLRREAQADLDDAKRAATEALDLDPESSDVNRAMAEFLLVDGAPAPEVERYLTRATQKRAVDGESAYVAAALAQRDGKLDDAKAKLTQANALNQAASQHALLRASYLLARVLVTAGDKEGARAALQTVLAANSQHDRARALLATLEPAANAIVTPPTASGTATAPVAPTGATVAAPAANDKPAVAASGASTKPEAAESDRGGGDYGKLVAQADHLSENGRAAQARKLYDKALQQRPNGLEALTGLGYCDVDGEKFSSAVDHFKQALAISPGYGEAIIGLAEAYKLRGDKQAAVEWYKKYLAALPGGPKAAMAKNNVRDLEPQKRDVETTTAPAGDTPKPPETTSATPASDKPDTKTETKTDKADDKPAPLPRLPTNDEPPP